MEGREKDPTTNRGRDIIKADADRFNPNGMARPLRTYEGVSRGVAWGDTSAGPEVKGVSQF